MSTIGTNTTINTRRMFGRRVIYTDETVINEANILRVLADAYATHPINGNEPLPTNNIGIERFKGIVDNAEKYDINIAIENQGNADYIGYVFDRVKSHRLRFCFDSGHEKFYSPGLDLLDLYGEKLSALHLHDNSGNEDTHALPFTGIIEWDKITNNLKEIDYKGAIAFETLNNGFEHIKNPVEFLGIALERAKRIL